MSADSTASLADRLHVARVAIRGGVVANDACRVVFSGSGRRVQDIIAHIACWEAEVAASIEAALKGGEHTLALPVDIDTQNEQYHHRTRDMSTDEVIEFWDVQRARFIDVVSRAVSPQMPIRCPWGGEESLVQLVDDMLRHEATHVQQIIGTNPGDQRQ